jgi:hypothetical protein
MVPESVLAAARRVVELVEPMCEEEYRVPETKRGALEQLDRLLVTCRWLATFDSLPEHRRAASQRLAEDLLDFVFEGHAEHDPRVSQDARVVA